MAVMPNTHTPDSLGRVPGPSGAIPGTEVLGVFLNELADLERKISGTWTVVTTNAPLTFEPLKLHRRVEMAAYTHKPLQCVWALPDLDVRDGDRIHRGDDSHWYVRGAPLAAPMGTHQVLIVEATAIDGLFAALNDTPDS